MFRDFKCILPCFVTNVKLCVSQGSVATNLKIGGKYCADFVDNSILYSTMKEFWKSVRNRKGKAEVRRHPFLRHSVLLFPILLLVVCHQPNNSNTTRSSYVGAFKWTRFRWKPDVSTVANRCIKGAQDAQQWHRQKSIKMKTRSTQ